LENTQRTRNNSNEILFFRETRKHHGVTWEISLKLKFFLMRLFTLNVLEFFLVASAIELHKKLICAFFPTAISPHSPLYIFREEHRKIQAIYFLLVCYIFISMYPLCIFNLFLKHLKGYAEINKDWTQIGAAR
jgi:hypothetical protein